MLNDFPDLLAEALCLGLDAAVIGIIFKGYSTIKNSVKDIKV